MKILIRKSDDAVIHARNDLVLTETEASGDLWMDQNFNTSNATLVDAELPEYWIGGVFAYKAGAWSIIDQPRYDEVKAAAEEAARIAAIPASITRRQGRLALLQTGYLDDVENALAGIADMVARRAAMIEYEADTWERSNPFLQQMWANLGGNERGLDDLFALAGSL